MIQEQEILSFNYLKKQDYSGSHQGMRYRLHKKGDEKAGETTVLEAALWPEPLNLEATEESLVEKQDFPFSPEGREEAIRWLNLRYRERFLEKK